MYVLRPVIPFLEIYPKKIIRHAQEFLFTRLFVHCTIIAVKNYKCTYPPTGEC